MALSDEEVEAVKDLRSRIHADASLASTAADTAGPLLFSTSTEVGFSVPKYTIDGAFMLTHPWLPWLDPYPSS